MLVAALATKAKNEEQPKYLPADEFIYIVLVPGIQEILPHPYMMNSGDIKLNQRVTKCTTLQDPVKFV